MTATIQLIAGLGNPGPDYAQTRHNAGALFVDELARTYNAHWQEDKKFFGLTCIITIESVPVRLLLPLTYMNRSGQSVGAIANFYKILPDNILIAHDELDLAPGIARFKNGGGHGGHNGLRDIISTLGNQTHFQRLRIGIGHPGEAKQVVNYVLKKAPGTEYSLMEDSITRAIQVLPEFVKGNKDQAMKLLHTSL